MRERLAALETLIAAAEDCIEAPLSFDPLSVVDLPVAARQAHRFKLDVSFSMRVDGVAAARLSINDTGEPEAFRQRLREAPLGLRAELLEAFLSTSRAGEVQTTVGLKCDADGALERVSLYHEELFRSPRGWAIRDDVAALACTAPVVAAPALEPGAACVDLDTGGVAAFKDYGIATERSEAPTLRLPASLERFRAFLPLDPVRGTRRYLLARRFDRGAKLVGAKLLWMSEAREPAAVKRAWGLLDALRARIDLPDSRPAAALDAVRSRWTHRSLLYPDLLGLDVDAAGRLQALVAYVSIRPE